MDIGIRGYRDTDLDVCRSLWTLLTEWHREIYDSPAIGGDNPGLQFDEQLEKAGRDRIWLAERQAEVVGMIGLQPGNDEGTLEIEPIVVVPEARGLGVGKKLIDHMIAVIKQEGLRDLNVRVVGRNSDAIRFYHQLGFTNIGYIELFLDTSPEADQLWRDGETIAGCTFRV